MIPSKYIVFSMNQNLWASFCKDFAILVNLRKDCLKLSSLGSSPHPVLNGKILSVETEIVGIILKTHTLQTLLSQMLNSLKKGDWL